MTVSLNTYATYLISTTLGGILAGLYAIVNEKVVLSQEEAANLTNVMKVTPDMVSVEVSPIVTNRVTTYQS